MVTKKIRAKVLTVDIETAPNIGVFFRTGQNQNIDHKQIIQERFIISVSWKWINDSKVYHLDCGLNRQDDYRLLKKFQKVLLSADLIVGQNSDAFDLKWINGRLAYHGLPAIPDKKAIMTLDTLKLARGAFNLNCFKLDYMLKYFGFSPKIKMDLDDWINIIIHKCSKSMAKMIKYNKKDVSDTEKLLLKILPYVNLPIHLGVLLYGGERDSCPNCGSNDRRPWSGSYNVGKTGLLYKRWMCKDCDRTYRDYKKS